MPVQDVFAKNGKVLPNGRMVYDMYLMQVKSPKESKGALEQQESQAVFLGGECAMDDSMGDRRPSTTSSTTPG